MTRVAIYEPDPRICGPDSWARHLRQGFRDIGCECDVVALTKSGKASARWGRVVRDKGMGQTCKLDPDVVSPLKYGGAVFDDYDLVVLTDVKCPTQDKPAYKAGEFWAPYIDILAGTDTPWVSALHGKWYFEEVEIPKGVNVERGSPFLAELLSLSNFAGYLIEHAPDGQYCQHSAKLRETRREYLPLPYALSTPEELALGGEAQRKQTICALGRVTKIKYRHLVNELARRGALPEAITRVLYGGGSSCQQGPNESYELYEQLVDAGWIGEREGGSKSASPWITRRPSSDLKVEFVGMYDDPSEISALACAHVGITDSGFSGGLLEFSTLEAVDGGCIPIISEPFTTPHTPEMIAAVLPFAFHGRHGMIRDENGFQKFDLSLESSAGIDETREAWLESLSTAISWASQTWSPETAAQNRAVIAKYHDPKIHARAFLKGAGINHG